MLVHGFYRIAFIVLLALLGLRSGMILLTILLHLISRDGYHRDNGLQFKPKLDRGAPDRWT